MKRHVLAACLLSLAAATSLGGALAGTGAVIYRANPQVFEDSGIAAPGSLVPVKLTLPAKTGVLVNAGDVLSSPSVATGPDAGFLLVARGGELRVCSSADCSGGGSFASSVRATNGGYVQARLAGPTTVGGVNRMTVESGSYTGTFEVSATSDAGLDPVADVVNAEPGSLQVSTASTLKGFVSATLSVTGGEYRLNSGAWTSASSTAKAGDKVELRVATGAFGTSKTATVSVAGGASISFTSSARGQDTLPDAFALASAANAEPGAQVVSAAVTPTGFEGSVAIAATGGEVSVAGGAFAASSTISLGQSFTVRTTSSASFGATSSAMVTVGTGAAVSFQVTTRAQDTLPDVFALADVTKVEPSTVTTSATTTPTGFEGSVPISVAGGQVSVAGGAYAASGTITSGQSFTVRTTSSASYATDATAQVTVGSGAAVTFKVRTRADVVLASQALTATVGTAYSFDFKTLTTTQGVAVSALSYASADKPSWMTLGANGMASGTPTAGDVSFTVSAAGPDGGGQRSYAMTVATPSTPVASVSTGFGHACAVTTAGGVKCWGANGSGQLGDGTTVAKTTPVDMQGMTSGAAQVVAANSLTCVLTTAGSVKCVGANGAGQLGNGTTTSSSTPVQVTGLTSGVVAITAANTFVCALTSGGAVKCWGDNFGGQLGNGTTTSSSTPVQVSGLTSGVTAVSAGLLHTCAVVSGAAKCWGYNADSRVGDGSAVNRSTPVQVTGLTSGVAQVTAGAYHSCALTTTGSVRCWGSSDNGQVGDGGTTLRTTPVQVSGMTSGVASISSGYTHNCAVTTAGAAKCWGGNGNGQVGDGTTVASRVSPTQVSGMTSGVARISGGNAFTCSVSTAGATSCWGLNDSGQAGDGTKTSRSIPASVTGL